MCQVFRDKDQLYVTAWALRAAAKEWITGIEGCWGHLLPVLTPTENPSRFSSLCLSPRRTETPSFKNCLSFAISTKAIHPKELMTLMWTGTWTFLELGSWFHVRNKCEFYLGLCSAFCGGGLMPKSFSHGRCYNSSHRTNPSLLLAKLLLKGNSIFMEKLKHFHSKDDISWQKNIFP